MYYKWLHCQEIPGYKRQLISLLAFQTAVEVNMVFIGPCIIVIIEEKNQIDATYYFIVLLIGSTCFGYYYAHHQELATMLITTLFVSFLVCCRLEVRMKRPVW